MVANKLSRKDVEEQADKLDFPNSVVEYFQGYLGPPTGGFPEPLRTKIIRDKPRLEGRPGANFKPYDFAAARAKLQEKFGKGITSTDVLSHCMYPKVFEEYRDFLEKYGDLSTLATRYFLRKPAVGEELNVNIGEGKNLIIRLLATGPVDSETGMRNVFLELNGETRAVSVKDNSAKVSVITREKATKEAGSVGAPMAGVIIEVSVKQGDRVKSGQAIAAISAMKMETAIAAPRGGLISRLTVKESDSVAGGDLICEITD